MLLFWVIYVILFLLYINVTLHPVIFVLCL